MTEYDFLYKQKDFIFFTLAFYLSILRQLLFRYAVCFGDLKP